MSEWDAFLLFFNVLRAIDGGGGSRGSSLLMRVGYSTANFLAFPPCS